MMRMCRRPEGDSPLILTHTAPPNELPFASGHQMPPPSRRSASESTVSDGDEPELRVIQQQDLNDRSGHSYRHNPYDPWLISTPASQQTTDTRGSAWSEPLMTPTQAVPVGGFTLPPPLNTTLESICSSSGEAFVTTPSGYGGGMSLNSPHTTFGIAITSQAEEDRLVLYAAVERVFQKLQVAAADPFTLRSGPMVTPDESHSVSCIRAGLHVKALHPDEYNRVMRSMQFHDLLVAFGYQLLTYRGSDRRFLVMEPVIGINDSRFCIPVPGALDPIEAAVQRDLRVLYPVGIKLRGVIFNFAFHKASNDLDKFRRIQPGLLNRFKGDETLATGDKRCMPLRSFVTDVCREVTDAHPAIAACFANSAIHRCALLSALRIRSAMMFTTVDRKSDDPDHKGPPPVPWSSVQPHHLSLVVVMNVPPRDFLPP